MGVTGLWRLIEPTGKPVPVETLENKVLAVDISIWLHQVVKGYQDAKGAPLPNAHLMGLFQRLCKLLYFKIKPVFVFDGAFPDLKKETIAKRQDSKSRYNSESERLKRELALLLSKKTAVTNLLGKQLSPTKKAGRADGPAGTEDDIFKLPALPHKDVESESESDDEDTSSGSIVDLHSVDLESDNFRQLPVKEKYDVLVELKETRKMNSWGRLHELPKKSDNFSDFQLKRLLKRRKVQECLEETEKEMGSSGMSLNDLETLLNEEGIDTKIDSLPTRRIASNENTRFLFIKNVKKALADAREQKNKQLSEVSAKAGSSKENDTVVQNSSRKIEVIEPISGAKKDELEDDLEKAIAMSLECVDEPNTNVANTTKTDDSWTSCLSDSDYSSSVGSDSEEADGFEHTDMSTAKAYIMQYSDYTHRAIEKIIDSRKIKDKAKAVPKVDEILQELHKEKPIISENIDLSSDEDGTSNTIKSEIKIEVDSDSDSIDLEPIIEENEPIADDKNVDKREPFVKRVKDDEVISLDTSNDKYTRTEEIATIKVTDTENVALVVKVNKERNPEIALKSDSSDSDEDFEEVTDVKTSTPVVEFSLNLGEAPEDDIFADVFQQAPSHSSKKIESIPFMKNEEVTPEKIVNNNRVPNDKLNSKYKNVDVNSDHIISHLTESKETNVSSRPTVKNDLALTSTSKTIENVPESVQNQFETSQNQPLNEHLADKPSESPIVSKTIEKPKEPVSKEQLNTMVEEIQAEEKNLIQEKGRLDRIGRNITEQMTKEAQELLQIFGIPYIVAPMEAEAQCAFLESVKLTDGTITDDSDIWLFGGKTVYKNFFNQKKHVLQFVSERIERSYNLSREQLILLALLVGSDYTTGVNGVGPVTALEILASFPYSKKSLNDPKSTSKYAHLVAGLQEFKKWIRSGRRTDDTSLKKKLKNVDITDDFPSVRVVQAYLEPNIEKSEDKFSWGELDITVLRDYTKAKFGWSQSKLDEIMKPVMKVMQDRQTQRSIQDYFKRKIDFQSLDDQMSKRVKAAVQKMGPDGHLLEENASEKPKSKVRKRKNSTNAKIKEADKNIEGDDNKVAKPSKTKAKQKKQSNEELVSSKIVKVKSVNEGETKVLCDVKVVKSDRFQETIPQREKEKQSLLQNKMKAIEVFRKTKLDPKSQAKKRRVNLPKEKAELSESDSD